MKHPNKEIMQRAIELAKESFDAGDYAVSAIVVLDDKIIAEATTTITREQNPVAHAEINAIEKAAKVLGSKKLLNCYLYTTYEPCPMCASAAIWARMQGIVYGATMEDATEKNPQRIKISAEKMIKAGTPKLDLYPAFMREECKALLSI